MKIEALCLNDHIADLSEAQTERLIASLPEWRREVALRFKHLQGRRECAVGYIELLRGLRLSYGIEEMPAFSFNEHGKPQLKDFPDIHFSISHCREAVGCLVSNRPCGLDIEHIRKAKEDLVRYTMSPQEVEAIYADPFPDIAFTRLWTQKEAVLKLTGHGLQSDMKTVLTDAKDIHIDTVVSPRGYVYSVASFARVHII